MSGAAEAASQPAREGAMGAGRATPATYVPLPRRPSAYPSAMSASYAEAAVLRAIPSSRAN